MLPQLPASQRCALVTRTGLVNPHMHRDSGVMGLVNGCQCRPPIHRRQPTGVAVGQDIDTIRLALVGPDFFDDNPSVLAQGRACFDILIGDFRRALISRSPTFFRRQGGKDGSQVIQGPAQIDRRWAGRIKHLASIFQSGVGGIFAHGQRHAVGGRRPDQGSATHQHVENGPGRIIQRFQPDDYIFVRQAGLVDYFHGRAVIAKPDGAGGFSVNQHDLPFQHTARHGGQLFDHGRIAGVGCGDDGGFQGGVAAIAA